MRSKLFILLSPIWLTGCFLMGNFTHTTEDSDTLRKFLIQSDEMGDVWKPETYKEITFFSSIYEFRKGTDFMTVRAAAADEPKGDNGIAQASPLEFRHKITQHKSVDSMRDYFGTEYYERDPDISGVDLALFDLNAQLEAVTLICNDANALDLQECRFFASFDRYATTLYITLDGETLTQEHFAELVTLATELLVENAEDDAKGWFWSLFD